MYTNSKRHSFGLGSAKRMRPNAGGVDRHQLSRLDVTHEVRTDDVERTRFAGEHPAALGTPEHERTETVTVAARRTRGLRPSSTSENAPANVGSTCSSACSRLPTVGAWRVAVTHGARQLADQLAVGREHPGQHAELACERFRVGEVAVVPETEPGVGDRPVDGLRIAPRARTGGGVTDVTDREVTVERREPALVEHLRDETHVLDDGDGLPVARRDAGRLLAAVLQRVQPEVGEVRDRLAGRIYAEDATRVAGPERSESKVTSISCRGGSPPSQRHGPAEASRIVCRHGPERRSARGLLRVVYRPVGRRQEHDRRDRDQRAAGPWPAGGAPRRRRGAGAPLEGSHVLERRPGYEHPPHRLGRELLARNGVVAVTAAISPYRALPRRGAEPDRRISSKSTSRPRSKSAKTATSKVSTRRPAPARSRSSPAYPTPTSRRFTRRSASRPPAARPRESAAEVVTWLAAHNLA